ncbi:MAG: hypothetical protein ABI598_02525 [Chloroflexota bacterium]
MTLPFRRRHNDQEASHDRARALVASGFTEPLETVDATWLEAHLEGCRECATDREDWASDRELFGSLRAANPDPPRDLWARTATAIERDAARRIRSGRSGRRSRTRRSARVPVGVAAGMLVVAVVVGASLVPRGVPFGSTPSSSDIAGASHAPQATSFTVDAYSLAWVQSGPEGSYEFRRARVDSVCPDPSGCATLDSGSSFRLTITDAPQSVIQSPTGSQIVVVTSSSSVGGAEVVVVAVPPSLTPEPSTPTPEPLPSATPTAGGETSPPASPSVVPTVSPVPTPTLSGPPSASGSPGTSPSPDVLASPEPVSGISIVSGVVVVGDTAYSPDGNWLAFSARPGDGSAGPDLYLWRVGDPRAAAVTSDHRTFFAAWLGDRILANRIEAAVPEGTANDLTAAPSAEPSAAGTADPSPSGEPTEPPVIEEHPVAFIFDPTSGASETIAAQDIWHPTVDPTGRFVVYWAGTVVQDESGTGWTPGTGSLVLDGWNDGLTPRPDASAAPSGLPGIDPSGVPGSEPVDPSAVPLVGPAGHPVTLAEGPGADFDAWFDPSGSRLATWVADPADPGLGLLRLIVLSSDPWGIDTDLDPLPGVTALRGVSINAGRLAWVTPPGQDGEGSHVQVLGWRARSFGQVRTIQADKLFVVR